jgi:hypothetical protein
MSTQLADSARKPSSNYLNRQIAQYSLTAMLALGADALPLWRRPETSVPQ